MVGGFLVAAAAVGVYVAASRDTATAGRSYVVMARSLPAGETITAADVRLASLSLTDGVAAHAFTDAGEVIGHLALIPLGEGVLVQDSAIAGDGVADHRVQLSIPVERARAVDGALQPGEKVDVYATFDGSGGARTLVVARGAEVRRVDSGSRSALNASDSTVLVLAVASADEALAVTHASQAGKVTIVRSTGVRDAGTSSSYRPPGEDG